MNKYQKLLDYYKKCFSLVDCFHYNSETSKEVFMQYLPTSKGQVVSITHGGIEDHRIRKVYGYSYCYIRNDDYYLNKQNNKLEVI